MSLCEAAEKTTEKEHHCHAHARVERSRRGRHVACGEGQTKDICLTILYKLMYIFDQ